MTPKTMEGKKCQHQFIEVGGNCVICGESSITTTDKKEKWSKRFENLIIKQLFTAWEMGKKQVKTPYQYTLDTDKLGRPIFDMAMEEQVHQREELKKKVEGMKMVLTKTEKELALRINKEALSACEAQVQFYNQALDDILTLLEEENEDRSKTRE